MGDLPQADVVGCPGAGGEHQRPPAEILTGQEALGQR